MTLATVLIRRRLDARHSPTQMLRVFRDRAGLVGLSGTWNHGSPLVAFDPLRTLGSGEDPFDALDDLPSVSLPGTDPEEDRGFGGGWIGVWGYPLATTLERLPDPPPAPCPVAPAHVAYYDSVLRFSKGSWWFEALMVPEAEDRIERRYAAVLESLERSPGEPAPYRCGPLTMTPAGAEHRRAVERTIEHIAAGDIFQANMCLRLEGAFQGDPLDLFCAGVERLEPDYAAFLRTADGAVASLSPELFLHRTGRRVLSSPIKGTAPLSQDMTTLASSTKDRAENIMIVDLVRNDLGRVCRPGSIRASSTTRPRRHTGVWHLVSDIAGDLRDGVAHGDLVRAAFPPGSVTGAPKVRAMEIINTEEATARSAYTGAIGYASPVAGLELSVVIRTFEFARERVWLGVGGGVVADSTPADELRECFVKAGPLLTAVGAKVVDSDEATAGRAGDAGLALPEVPALAADGVPDPSYGLIETLLVASGHAAEARLHVERLARSVAELYDTELDVTAVLQQVHAAAVATRGAHRLRLVAPAGTPDQVAVELEPTRTGGAPWSLVPVLLPGGHGRHKWRDRSALDPAGLPGPEYGPDEELLLVDSDGCVLETARANVFLVMADGVHTPAADGRLLPGVTRGVVLDVLREAGVPAFERPITIEDLAAADEVFVTNALRGVHPVTSARMGGGGRNPAPTWPVGSTTRWLSDRLDARRAQPSDDVRSPGEDTTASPPGRSPSRPQRTSRSVLLVDNYDSFVYNLAQYVEELGSSTTVVRNDDVSVEELVRACADASFTHVVISPGPGTPREAGVSEELVTALGGAVPVLGVCLGHQCICEAYGARVVRASRPMHGKANLVHHDGRGVFTGLEGPLLAARYHSLEVVDVPADLVVTARTASGTVMGARHRVHRVEGIQVHPESILTPRGHDLVANFLRTVPAVRGH